MLLIGYCVYNLQLCWCCIVALVFVLLFILFFVLVLLDGFFLHWAVYSYFNSISMKCIKF